MYLLDIFLYEYLLGSNHSLHRGRGPQDPGAGGGTGGGGGAPPSGGPSTNGGPGQNGTGPNPNSRGTFITYKS